MGFVKHLIFLLFYCYLVIFANKELTENKKHLVCAG